MKKRRPCFVNTRPRRRRGRSSSGTSAQCALASSFLVDGCPRLCLLPPFHFGKAPNVSIVGSGAESGGRGGGRRTKPRQEHKHHENMALSAATVAALKRCGSHSPDWAHPGTHAAILYAQDCLSAASPNPFGRRTSDKKASNGFRRSNHVLRTAHKNTPVNRISIDRPAREGHNGRHESRADMDISRKFLNMLGAFRYLFQFLALMCSGAAAAAIGAPSLN